MGKNDCINVTRGNRRILPITLAPLLRALKQSAINKDLKTIFAVQI